MMLCQVYGTIADVPLAYTIVGVGDFDGDSKSDVLWRNTSDGDTVIWLMNGTTLLSGKSLGIVPTLWRVQQ